MQTFSPLLPLNDVQHFPVLTATEWALMLRVVMETVLVEGVLAEEVDCR
jgi:hypothetical protein